MTGPGAAEAVDHGGSIERARALFAGAPEPWLDLSTGINPHSYPLLNLPATVLTRLPEPGRAHELEAAAARAYGAPSADCVVAGPGTQLLLPLVYGLRAPGRAAVLSPTYAEHARAATLAGHHVAQTAEQSDLAGADIAVVVNPNNPDGRVIGRSELLALAGTLRARRGLLVVDEAFMDAGPRGESLAGDVTAGGIVVLRSFGKFFGLAGLRLGFALTDPVTAARLGARLGPWAVSGPALEYGLAALSDTAWQDAMRAQLMTAAARLDGLLASAGIAVTGGTPLYRFIVNEEAPALFSHLGRRGILARHFAGRPKVLRIGMPGPDGDWQRLADALSAWRVKVEA